MLRLVVLDEKDGKKVYDNYSDRDKRGIIATEDIIADILEKSGFNPRFIGFNYLIQAVILCYRDRELLICKTKVLYPRIAKLNKVTTASIERNIRTVINAAWAICEGNYFYHRLGCGSIADNKRPTCGEIINLLTEYLDNLFE